MGGETLSLLVKLPRPGAFLFVSTLNPRSFRLKLKERENDTKNDKFQREIQRRKNKNKKQSKKHNWARTFASSITICVEVIEILGPLQEKQATIGAGDSPITVPLKLTL